MHKEAHAADKARHFVGKTFDVLSTDLIRPAVSWIGADNVLKTWLRQTAIGPGSYFYRVFCNGGQGWPAAQAFGDAKTKAVQTALFKDPVRTAL